LKGRLVPAKLDSYLDIYESAAEDARALLLMTSRRIQQHLTELSIEESQRSIREAASVKRLTQLAFVFIPLTFATSIFGMNLDILTGNGPRFWLFMVTAICVPVIVFGLWQTSRIFERWWKPHKDQPTSFY
jgi:Mg2+ and Co2+ transporter CorA